MTRIAVLSDIHIPGRMADLPLEALQKTIGDVDMIFALGDYDSREGYDLLHALGKSLHSVCGNMDPFTMKKSMDTHLHVSVEDCIITMTHGWGPPWGIRERIAQAVGDGQDCICYGHTHTRFWGLENGIRFFNPGALCDNDHSFGILEIDGKEITHHFLNC
jgi:putative phosphoesterase